MPWAAVPMVISDEGENARALDIESDIFVLGKLIKEVTGIGAFISAAAVIGATHVGPSSNSLEGPAVPLAGRLQGNGGSGGGRGGAGADKKKQKKKTPRASPRRGW